MRLGPALQLIAALVLAASPACAGAPRAAYLGSYEWTLPQDWFGGLSGIELSEDGTRMAVISDRAWLACATIARRGDRITAVTLTSDHPLRGHDGARLIGGIVDAEGLAIAPDGTIHVSFEGIHRVSRYPDPAGASVSLKRPREFRALPGNAGFEALAIDAQGRLLAMPEEAFTRKGEIPVFRWAKGDWSRPFTLPSDGAFLPVGADIGPDGRLYLLERAYNIFGFRSRVRSWQIDEDSPTDERLDLQTATGTHDNLEGLSVWRDAQGRLRLTMVSDDNFLALQRTELVEYALIN
jgi:hypothetical protein